MIKIISIIFLFLLTACEPSPPPFVSYQVIQDAESACKLNGGLKGISNLIFETRGKPQNIQHFNKGNVVCNNSATFKFEERY